MRALAAFIVVSATLFAQGIQADLDAMQERAVQLTNGAQFEEAISLAEKAVRLAESLYGPEHKETALSLSILGTVYHMQGQYGKAEPLFVRALAIRQKVLGPDSPPTITSLSKLAAVYVMQGQYAKAEPLLVRALKTSEAAKEPDDQTLPLLANLAALYHYQGQYGKAEPLLVRALAMSEKALGPDNPETAIILDDLAGVYERLGEYAKAQPLDVRALAIRERSLGPDHPDVSRSLANLASVFKLQGEYDKAEPLYTRALAIRETVLGPEHPDTAESLSNLAGLYSYRGLYAKAEPLYQRALTIRGKVLGPEHPDTARSLINLATLYNSLAQYAKAESLYMRAITIQEKALRPEHPDTAESLNSLAVLYKNQGLYAKAQALLVRGLAIQEKALGLEHPSTATTLNNLAEVYKSEGQYAKAEPLYSRALAIREKALGPENPETAISLNNLAGLFETLGQDDKAESLYVRALAIEEKFPEGENAYTAVILNNLALLYFRGRQNNKAEPLFARAIALLANNTQGRWDPMVVKASDNLAVFLIDNGQRERAAALLGSTWPSYISWFDRTLATGRESFRREWTRNLQASLSLLINSQQASQTLRSLGLEAVLKSKSRISEELAVALGALRQRADPAAREKIDQLFETWAQMRNTEQPNAPDRSRWKELRDREDSLIAEIGALNEDSRSLLQTPSLAGVRSRLGDAALVELVRFNEIYFPERGPQRFGPERYGAYVARRQGDIVWLDLGPAEDVDKLIRRYRNAVSQPVNDAAARRRAGELEKLLFRPIQESVPDVREFYLAPDGPTHLVPFAALLDESGESLLKRFNIHILSTGRDLVIAEEVASLQAPIIGGIESFGKKTEGRLTFDPLPGAEAEARTVAELIPSARLAPADQLDRKFLLERVYRPQILHLATHGYFHANLPEDNTDPLLRGGIALKRANETDEGILTAKDASMLQLRGTQLVVLSACETGVGETSFPDGVIGLQRSLRLAGARSEILTLWPVSDEKTRELMVVFYRNLFERKLTKSEALRAAQGEMLDRGIDPYFWAPFVLYGDPGPLR